MSTFIAALLIAACAVFVLAIGALMRRLKRLHDDAGTGLETRIDPRGHWDGFEEYK